MASSWRTNLWGYLAGRQGERLTVAGLLGLFADEIPLHHASRIWLLQNSSKRRVQLESGLRMRRHTLLAELRHYPLVWLPPHSKQRAIADTDVLIPFGRACVHCGAPFFAQLPTLSCGRSCSRKAAWVVWRERNGKTMGERYHGTSDSRVGRTTTA